MGADGRNTPSREVRCGVLSARRSFRRRLGGITGDCLGAANQLVELAVYLALVTGGPRS